jgi:S1-C subfamily serine protease
VAVAAAATQEVLPVAFLTSALLGSVLLASLTTPLSRPPTVPDEPGTTASAPADSSLAGSSGPAAASGLFAAADKVRATVVGIRARTLVTVKGPEGEEQRSATALGSGVAVGPSLILTSLHVIAVTRQGGPLETVEEIEALFPRLGAISAHVVAIDPALDLALLKLDTAVSTQATASLAEGAAGQGELLALGVLDGDLVAVPVQRLAATERVRPAGTPAALLRLATDLGSAFWGSPLFDAEGRLAGMVVAAVPGRPAAQPAAALRKLLEGR